MTVVLRIGSGTTCTSADDRRRHEGACAAVGRMCAWVDPHPSNVARDLIVVDRRRTVVESDPQGNVRVLSDADAAPILHDVDRYGPVSWSNTVAEELTCRAQLGLPCSPDLSDGSPPVLREGRAWRLALPDTPFDALFVESNFGLRDSLMLDTDAEWLAEEDLSQDDVRALNAATHDLFEMAIKHQLITSVR